MTPEQKAEAIRIRARARSNAMNMAAAQEQIDAAAPDEWYEDFGEGLAVSGMETYYGIKDLIGKMDDDDRATLEDWRQDASESGWGTAGQVVGDIAQTVAPGGAALRGLKAAGKIKNISKGMKLGTDIGSSAALGFLQAPEGDESRTGQAIKGATGAVGGHMLGKALGKIGTGISKTPAAKKLMGEGVQLTPGQAAENPMWRGAETMLSINPLSGKTVSRLQERALGQWNLKALNDVRPPGMEALKSIGQESNKKLVTGFKDAYNAAWKKAGPPPDRKLYEIAKSAGEDARRLDSSSKTVIAGVMEDVAQLSRQYSPEKLRLLDNSLRKSINAANSKTNPNKPLSDALKKIKDQLRESASQEARDELQKIDRQYRKYKTVVKAAAQDTSQAMGEAFTPQSLNAAARSVGGEGQLFGGAAPMQEIATEGLATVGRKEPAVLANVPKAIARNLGMPNSYLERMGNVLMGDTSTQQGLRNLAGSPLAEALRKAGLSSAAITGAISGG